MMKTDKGWAQFPDSPKRPKHSDFDDDCERYKTFPRLTAQQGWQLVSLHRLLTASCKPPAPAIDLLSGLGEDAPEEHHLLNYISGGEASVSPVEVADVLAKLGYPPQEVELWKMAAANGGAAVEPADFLAVLACKLDGKESALEKDKLKVAFDAIDLGKKGALCINDLKQGTLALKTTLARYGLEDLCIELTDEEVAVMMSEAMATSKESLSYEEFAHVIQAVAPVGD
jgi:Ca2+-binding EF-hand superfamily protein